MKMFKKFAVVMLAVAVLFTMTVPTMAAASDSPAKKTPGTGAHPTPCSGSCHF